MTTTTKTTTKKVPACDELLDPERVCCDGIVLYPGEGCDACGEGVA